MSQSPAATIDTPYVGPVSGNERYSSIDVVRGVALFGILLMNIIVFGHGIGPAEFLREGYVYDANFWVWVVESTYFEGTQRTLFSLLFGAGVIILTSRAEARGAGIMTADIYYRRNLWLIAFGMIDAYLLLWDGDILFYYGLAALFLFPLRKMKPAHLVLAGLACIAILIAERIYDANEVYKQHDEFLAAQAIVDEGGELDEEQQAALDGWKKVLEESGYNEEKHQENLDAHRGSYWDTFKRHVPFLTKMHGNITYRFIFLDVISMMLLGMALMKWGYLTLEKSPRHDWMLVLVGYGVGLPISIWETHTVVMDHWSALAWARQGPTYDIGRLAMACGHLGLLMLFVRSGRLRWLQERLAAVGRMALTNYLMHSVLCAFIFLGIGFGMYGVFERYELYYVVLAICLFQLLVSKHWLAHFRFGPAEWLWRSLTYLQKQPMRRAPRAVAPSDSRWLGAWAWFKRHW